MDSKSLRIFVFSTFFVTISVLLFLIWNLIYPWNIATFEENPIPIVNPGKVVVTGTPLLYHLRVTKHVDTRPIIVRRFVNGIKYTMEDYRGSHGAGTFDSVVSSTIVPEHLPPGVYYMELSFVYEFWLRQETQTVRTEKFTVVEREK